MSFLSFLHPFDIIVYLFWFIILGSFIKLLSSDSADEYFKKIIWGLSILVFALISDNAWVIWVAVFIWGLLIATEKFLIHLAWIFSSKHGTDLTTIYDSFSGRGHWIKEEKVTEEEKIQAIEEESKEEAWKIDSCETIKHDVPLSPAQRPMSERIENPYKNIIEIENTIIELFRSSFKDFLSKLTFQKDVRIQNEYGASVLDWIIKDGETIIAGIEIKILRTPQLNTAFYVKRFIEKTRFLKLEFPFILIIAAANLDPGEVSRIRAQFSNFEDIILLFFNYKDEPRDWHFINELNTDRLLGIDRKSRIRKIFDANWNAVNVKIEDGRIRVLGGKFLE